MLPVGQRLDGAEPVHDVVRVAEVDLVERAPNNGISLRGAGELGEKWTFSINFFL